MLLFNQALLASITPGHDLAAPYGRDVSHTWGVGACPGEAPACLPAAPAAATGGCQVAIISQCPFSAGKPGSWLGARSAEGG